jgi:hypothetical protein
MSGRIQGEAMPKRQPLWKRLYREPALFDLARAIGYDVLALEEARVRAKPLAEKYGKAVMEQASKEIVCIDTSTNPPTVRLTDEARRICWQLLGPPSPAKDDVPLDGPSAPQRKAS